jgi:hypothetical protein
VQRIHSAIRVQRRTRARRELAQFEVELHEFHGGQASVPWRATHQHRLEGARIAPFETKGAGVTQDCLNTRTREAVGSRPFPSSEGHRRGGPESDKSPPPNQLMSFKDRSDQSGMGDSSLDRNEEQDPCLHGSKVEQAKEEDDFAHQVGKRTRKEPLFGGALQTIVFPGTRQKDKRSHRRAGNKKPQRCCSDDRKRCRIGDRSQ